MQCPKLSTADKQYIQSHCILPHLNALTPADNMDTIIDLYGIRKGGIPNMEGPLENQVRGLPSPTFTQHVQPAPTVTPFHPPVNIAGPYQSLHQLASPVKLLQPSAIFFYQFPVK